MDANPTVLPIMRASEVKFELQHHYSFINPEHSSIPLQYLCFLKCSSKHAFAVLNAEPSKKHFVCYLVPKVQSKAGRIMAFFQVDG